MNFKIIPITEEYIEGYWAAVDSVAREHKYLAFLEGPPLAMSHSFVLKNIKENRPHFIAICDEEVVGWCDIASLERPVFAHAGVLGMGVKAPYRGKGTGKALISAALDKAKTIGLIRIELTVREKNKSAFALYTKVGFIKEGFHRNAVRIGNEYENHISMALIFDK